MNNENNNLNVNEGNNLNNVNNNDVSVDNFFNPQPETAVNSLNQQEIPTDLNTNVIPNNGNADTVSANSELNPPMPTVDTSIQTNDVSAANNNGMNNVNDSGVNSVDSIDNNSSNNIPSDNLVDGMESVSSINPDPVNVDSKINVEQPKINNSVPNNNTTSEPNINVDNSVPNTANTPNIVMEQPTPAVDPMNNMNGQNPNMAAPTNVTVVNKKSNKGLVIVLIVVMLLAIAAAVAAYFLVINKDSKTENDYEGTNTTNSTDGNTNTTSTTTSTNTDSSTIENDGYIYTKKSGYNYEIEDGILFIYNASTAFEFMALPVNYDAILSQTDLFEETMSGYGYSLANKKEESYGNKKVLSYETSADGKNVLYFVYAIDDDNSMQVISYDKSNKANYDTINQALKLTEDIKKSNAATYSKSSDSINFSEINSKLFE